jgi:hypothetical protein
MIKGNGIFGQKIVPKQEEGCKIKIKRDSEGRIKEIVTNSKCTKQDLELFRENLSSRQNQESSN